jgi:hypothetical protein
VQRFLGALIVVVGLVCIAFPEHIPTLSQLLATYWLRAAGGALALLGLFLFWADGG